MAKLKGCRQKMEEQTEPFDKYSLACLNPVASNMVKKSILGVGVEFHKQLVVPQVKYIEVLHLVHEGLFKQSTVLFFTNKFLLLRLIHN